MNNKIGDENMEENKNMKWKEASVVPKCPKCKKPIEQLIRTAQRLFSLKRGYSIYVDGLFYCPECEEPLFNIEMEATEFLKGNLQLTSQNG